MPSSAKTIVASLAVVLTAAMCTSSTCTKQTQEAVLQGGVFQDITVQEAFTLIQDNTRNPNFIILDVRTLQEFNEGHIANAVHFDYYAPDFRDRLDALDKEKTYLVYCRSGNRSRQTMSAMQDLEFTTVYNMLEGIIASTSAEYPVV